MGLYKGFLNAPHTLTAHFQIIGGTVGCAPVAALYAMTASPIVITCRSSFGIAALLWPPGAWSHGIAYPPWAGSVVLVRTCTMNCASSSMVWK